MVVRRDAAGVSGESMFAADMRSRMCACGQRTLLVVLVFEVLTHSYWTSRAKLPDVLVDECPEHHCVQGKYLLLEF